MINETMVRKVAKIARLDLSEEEIKKLAGEKENTVWSSPEQPCSSGRSDYLSFWHGHLRWAFWPAEVFCPVELKRFGS